MQKILILSIFHLLTSATIFATLIHNNPLENSLIIYSGNIALVYEKHKLNIKESDKKIIYKNVPLSIEIGSLNMDFSNEVSIHSWKYINNILTKEELINAHIGKSIEIQISKDIKKAKLLSCDKEKCLTQIQDKIITIKSDDIIFDKKILNKFSKPSLEWDISTKKDLNSDMNLQYLIKDIHYKNNYILNIKDDNSADLSGWTTIKNNSGKDFNSTSLFILAGDVNTAQNQNISYKKTRTDAIMSAETLIMQENSFEGYYLYPISIKTDLKNNENIQICFLDKINVKITKKYFVNMSSPLYLRVNNNYKITKYIHIENLDKPLPKGVIRTYSKLGDTNIFLGQSTIEHTPKNGDIDIMTGKEFDLTAQENILQRKDDKKYYDADIIYTVKNNSSNDMNIDINIPFKKHIHNIINTQEKYMFTKNGFVTFDISIKAKEKKSFKVNFRIKKGI